VINTARGALIEEAALVGLLLIGKAAGTRPALVEENIENFAKSAPIHIVVGPKG
jgi:lactate dehydrogenase-like 2-hydroxyacid dehydrogenase